MYKSKVGEKITFYPTSNSSKLPKTRLEVRSRVRVHGVHIPNIQFRMDDFTGKVTCPVSGAVCGRNFFVFFFFFCNPQKRSRVRHETDDMRVNNTM